MSRANSDRSASGQSAVSRAKISCRKQCVRSSCCRPEPVRASSVPSGVGRVGPAVQPPFLDGAEHQSARSRLINAERDGDVRAGARLVAIAELDETMAAFLSADEPTMRPHIDRFVERGWTYTADDGAVALTGEGRRAHQRVAEQSGALRVRMMECLSSEEHTVLTELLQRVATHLDALAVEEL